MLQTRGGRLLSIEIPSDVTFAQRRGWADNPLWADNTYFTVIPKTLFTSFGQNLVGDEGASAMADVLRVNRSLKALRYVSMKM